jgi:hypothetical protein
VHRNWHGHRDGTVLSASRLDTRWPRMSGGWSSRGDSTDVI